MPRVIPPVMLPRPGPRTPDYMYLCPNPPPKAPPPANSHHQLNNSL